METVLNMVRDFPKVVANDFNKMCHFDRKKIVLMCYISRIQTLLTPGRAMAWSLGLAQRSNWSFLFLNA